MNCVICKNERKSVETAATHRCKSGWNLCDEHKHTTPCCVRLEGEHPFLPPTYEDVEHVLSDKRSLGQIMYEALYMLEGDDAQPWDDVRAKEGYERAAQTVLNVNLARQRVEMYLRTNEVYGKRGMP